MRIKELGADEFACSMALIADAVAHVMNGGVGEQIVKEVAAGAGKASDEESAAEWGIGIIKKYLPHVLKENVEDVYRVLAACDGQTLEQYKEAFKPAKFAADLNALVGAFKADGEIRELFGSFFG